jgi:hypothetical protein
MIKGKLNNGKTVHIPNTWSDIRVKQYANILKDANNQTRLIAHLVGISESESEKLDTHSLMTINHCCSFIQSNFNPNDWVAPEKINIEGIEFNPLLDIKTKTFGQKIAFQMAVAEKEIDIIDNVLTILDIYFQPILTSKPFNPDESEKYKSIISEQLSLTDAFSIHQNYRKQLLDVIDREKAMLSKKPTFEQMRAGISMFDEFGVMNIVDTLANGDVLKYDAILNLEYNTVFLKLRKSYVESIFQENYSKVLSQKNK